MMCKRESASWNLALAFSLLSLLAGCSNEGTQTRREPAKTPPQLLPLDAAMLQAAGEGDNAKVKDLLAKGVNVNLRGNDHNTPIMEAAYAGHLDTVKLFLDHGADLSARKNDGATPIALAGAHKDVVELFKNVADLVEAAGKGNNPAVKELIDKGTPVNGLDQYGHSALTESCWNGFTDTVKLLLDRGADPNIKKSDGATPLSLAMGQKHQEVVALLNEAIARQSKGTPKQAAK
jgi:ankyrin repeat protein